MKCYVDANPDTLPIILSLENHCSHHFQAVIADILTNTLKDRLYIPEESSGPLPSPLDLVGKVCIKGKRPPENDDDEFPISASESDDEEGLDPESALKSGPSTKSDIPLPQIFPELARLTLFNGVKFTGFSTSIRLKGTDMHSFNETKIMKVLNNDTTNATEKWKQYNKDHMTRTYPAGSRVDSSNYNPVVSWHVGSQLVALNFQTEDSEMTINAGR